MQFRYEKHKLNSSILPFILQTDRIIKAYNRIPNYHPNIELLFCYEGRGTVICGTTSHEFSQGDVIVINSNELHNIVSETEIRFYVLIIDEEFCLANGIDISSYWFKTRIVSKEMRDAYNSVIKAFASNGKSSIPSVRYAVLGLLILLVNNYSVPADERILASNLISTERVKKVLEYIHSKLDEQIRLDDISAHVGVSKYHLTRDFKKFTSHTIFEYINIARCTAAASLIAGGMSVSSAALSCGFENMSYFTRTYKKHIGTLPSKQKQILSN